MITATARLSVKRRLDIDDTDTTFDGFVDEFVLAAVNRLYPIAQAEVPRAEQSVTVDTYGEATVDLAALGALSGRSVESFAGGAWSPATDTYHHGTSLYVRDLSTSVTKVRVYGTTVFSLSTVPIYLEQAVVWYAMSEFYDFLAGSKKNYNIYMQSGARDVDNMRDESQFFEQKANVYLTDRAQLYGLS